MADPRPTCEEIGQAFLLGARGNVALLEVNFFDNKRRIEFAFTKDGVTALISTMLHPDSAGIGMWERAALKIAPQLGQVISGPFDKYSGPDNG